MASRYGINKVYTTGIEREKLTLLCSSQDFYKISEIQLNLIYFSFPSTLQHAFLCDRYALHDDLKRAGEVLCESNAIARVIGGQLLWGGSLEEKALIYQWIEFADKEVNPAVCLWCFPFLGLRNYNKQVGW